MTEETIRPLSQEATPEGGVSAGTELTSVGQKIRGSMVIPPTTVVPVIFVPGIMGSNLRVAPAGKSIWNVNSKVGFALHWIFRSAKTRQKRLVLAPAEVHDRGTWYGKSATVPDRKTGKARGQGTTSKAFYGDFVQWLDNNLNAVNGAAAESTPSPWTPYENVDFREKWHAEKPFQKLTGLLEADNPANNSPHVPTIWGNFRCPVHVVGYNWLQSNGDSGKDLAKEIEKIIAEWDGKKDNSGPELECKQVILVTHSMGGLVARAAVHPELGNAASNVLGIVHGELPANGAAAAYHHCRSGYDGLSGLALGSNAAQVTAIFSNSPGAMELLPNQQYPMGWLKVRVGEHSAPVINLPQSDPYDEIYLEQDRWWRLVNPKLINPSGEILEPWKNYKDNVISTSKFHLKLGMDYHPQTYTHYGADQDKYPTYGDLVWNANPAEGADPIILLLAKPAGGSNPVKVELPGSQSTSLTIMSPNYVGYDQSGDGTVPACSGEAPFKQGGDNVKQSFRLNGFDHQGSYNNPTAQQATLYAVGMLLQRANVL